MKMYGIDVNNVFEDGLPPIEKGFEASSINVIFMGENDFGAGYADYGTGCWTNENREDFQFADYPFWFVPPPMPTQEKNSCTND